MDYSVAYFQHLRLGMVLHKDGIDVIKYFEGFYANVYLCPSGVWTVGCRNTAYLKSFKRPSEVQITNHVTEDLLLEDCRYFSKESEGVFRGDGLGLYRHSALVSFSYNLGGGCAPRSSALRRKIAQNPRNLRGIERQFLRWKFVKNRVLRGLELRRRGSFACIVRGLGLDLGFMGHFVVWTSW